MKAAVEIFGLLLDIALHVALFVLMLVAVRHSQWDKATFLALLLILVTLQDEFRETRRVRRVRGFVR